jgi:hypothetical protein
MPAARSKPILGYLVLMIPPVHKKTGAELPAYLHERDRVLSAVYRGSGILQVATLFPTREQAKAAIRADVLQDRLQGMNSKYRIVAMRPPEGSKHGQVARATG